MVPLACETLGSPNKCPQREKVDVDEWVNKTLWHGSPLCVSFFKQPCAFVALAKKVAFALSPTSKQTWTWTYCNMTIGKLRTCWYWSVWVSLWGVYAERTGCFQNICDRMFASLWPESWHICPAVPVRERWERLEVGVCMSSDIWMLCW